MLDLPLDHTPQPLVQALRLSLRIDVHSLALDIQLDPTLVVVVVVVLTTARILSHFASLIPLLVAKSPLTLTQQHFAVAGKGKDVDAAYGFRAQELVGGWREERRRGLAGWRGGLGDEDGGEGCAEGYRGGEECEQRSVEEVGEERERLRLD